MWRRSFSSTYGGGGGPGLYRPFLPLPVLPVLLVLLVLLVPSGCRSRGRAAAHSDKRTRPCIPTHCSPGLPAKGFPRILLDARHA